MIQMERGMIDCMQAGNRRPRPWPSCEKVRWTEGYRVEGFAPTSRAAQKLAEAGIDTCALQMHLARGRRPDTGEHRLSCWTNLRSFPQRCMSSSASFIEMTVSWWLVTLASTRLPRQDGRLRNFRKRALPDIMPTSKNASAQPSSVLADHGLRGP
jgi:hypothetical protein